MYRRHYALCCLLLARVVCVLTERAACACVWVATRACGGGRAARAARGGVAACTQSDLSAQPATRHPPHTISLSTPPHSTDPHYPPTARPPKANKLAVYLLQDIVQTLLKL